MTLLRLEKLVVEYAKVRGREKVRAVDGMDLEIAAAETVGLVGESGSGKSTVARTLVGLVRPQSGRILFRPPESGWKARPELENLLSAAPDEGIDLAQLPPRQWKPIRRAVSMVFQDPISSLNPRMRAWKIVAEPLQIHGLARGSELRRRVDGLIERVGLPLAVGENLPHQLSGGQRQRLGIARALANDPLLVLCDEAVSALDVSVQAQILGLLRELQEERGLAYLFITHDLAVVRHIADRVAVMVQGQIVETGAAAQLFAAPQHSYTQTLLAAVPTAFRQ